MLWPWGALYVFGCSPCPSWWAELQSTIQPAWFGDKQGLQGRFSILLVAWECCVSASASLQLQLALEKAGDEPVVYVAGEHGWLLVLCTSCMRAPCRSEGDDQFSVAKPS